MVAPMRKFEFYPLPWYASYKGYDPYNTCSVLWNLIMADDVRNFRVILAISMGSGRYKLTL
jgi:hypothetical protein